MAPKKQTKDNEDDLPTQAEIELIAALVDEANKHDGIPYQSLLDIEEEAGTFKTARRRGERDGL
jgi:hypothetical protein